MLSAGYHVFADLAPSAEASPIPATVAPALGPDPRLAAVLARRLEDVGLRHVDSIVLAAAGSTDERAVVDCEHARELLELRLGRRVGLGYVSAASPRVADVVATARAEKPANRVVIATYLLAPGYFADLIGRSGADVTTAPLLMPEDTPAELVETIIERATLRAHSRVAASS